MLEKQPRNITSSSLSSSVTFTLMFGSSSLRGEPLSLILDSSCSCLMLPEFFASTLGQLAFTGECLLIATTLDGKRCRDTTGRFLVGVLQGASGESLEASFSCIAVKPRLSKNRIGFHYA